MQKYKTGISVVIPCLNEAESIAQTVQLALQGIAEAGEQGEVVVVDNGSTDGSPALATAAGARVLHETLRGYGAALRRGFAEARFDIMVMGDADLTYDFSKLSALTVPIRSGEQDMMVGNRMRNIKPGAMPWLHQYVGNPILSFMVRVMFHNHAIKDVHCGMRAISHEAYDQLQCVTTGMEFASEMVIRAIRCKLRIAERDIIYHPRTGDSKLRSFQDGWRHLRFMILHSPTSMLIMPGVVIWLLGLAVLIRLAFGTIEVHGRVFDIHSMIMGGLLSVISMQLIVVGLLAKAYAHLSGLYHDPAIAWLYRKLTFEKSIFYVTPFVLLGLGLTLWVVTQWIAGGFGPLSEARLLFFGLICLVNGVQLGTSSYLFSIMALPRHIDRMPPAQSATGIADL